MDWRFGVDSESLAAAIWTWLSDYWADDAATMNRSSSGLPAVQAAALELIIQLEFLQLRRSHLCGSFAVISLQCFITSTCTVPAQIVTLVVHVEL